MIAKEAAIDWVSDDNHALLLFCVPVQLLKLGNKSELLLQEDAYDIVDITETFRMRCMSGMQ